jgi:hypothetical protein
MARLFDPPPYRGDAYSWRITFPDASFLVGAPGNVKADIKRPKSEEVEASWTVAVDGASLVLSLEPVDLFPREYRTDVQVGDTTYIRSTLFCVLPDVSL